MNMIFKLVLANSALLCINAVSTQAQSQNGPYPSVAGVEAQRYEVRGRMMGNCGGYGYELDDEQKDSLAGILTQDVYRYYQLESKYDTPLKRSFFVQTEDFKQKAAEIKREYSKLIRTDCYAEYQPVDCKLDGLAYDLKAKGFAMPAPVVTTSGTVYFDFGDIHIPLPPTVTVAGDGRILLRVIDQRKALAIEESRESLALLVLFRFTSATRLKQYIHKRYVFRTQPERLLLYNRVSGEVYSEYTYPSVVGALKSKLPVEHKAVGITPSFNQIKGLNRPRPAVPAAATNTNPEHSQDSTSILKPAQKLPGWVLAYIPKVEAMDNSDDYSVRLCVRFDAEGEILEVQKVGGLASAAQVRACVEAIMERGVMKRTTAEAREGMQYVTYHFKTQ